MVHDIALAFLACLERGGEPTITRFHAFSKLLLAFYRVLLEISYVWEAC